MCLTITPDTSQIAEALLHNAALATEPPTEDLLAEKPHGRSEPLINGAMWRQILSQVFYQVLVIFLVFFGAPQQIKSELLLPLMDVPGIKRTRAERLSQMMLAKVSLVLPSQCCISHTAVSGKSWIFH